MQAFFVLEKSGGLVRSLKKTAESVPPLFYALRDYRVENSSCCIMVSLV